MNENSKTLTFLAVGLVALVGGWFLSMPSADPDVEELEINQPFFADFNDPQKVAAAEVLDFDATTDTKHDLKAARVDDGWQLNPEKQGYPEVSTERLADVIAAVSGLKKLSVASNDRSQHRQFGVVDPGSATELKEGSDGVGKRVTLLDDRKKPLVDLIVGKVDDKNPKLHYVRRPGIDRVYRTEVESDPLSSRFDDWVKPDLLGVGTAELRSVRINDQSIDVRNMQQPAGGGIVMVRKVPVRIEKARADVAKDDENKWQAKRLETFDKEKKTFVTQTLAAAEEVDASKLSTLGQALKNVKIVDVMKKPKPLADDLKAPVTFLGNLKSPVLQSEESLDALQLTGFFPNPSPLGGGLDLICHEGDMTVGLSDGVQYTLRFGDITGKGRGAADAEKKEDGKPGEAKPDETKPEGTADGGSTSPNRYLFVTASFNPDLIPKPKLEEVPPETPAATPPAATPPAATPPAATPPAATPPAATPPAATPSATTPAGTTPVPAKTEEPKPADATKKEEPKTPTKVDADDASSCDQEPEKKDEPKPTATATPTAAVTATPSATATAAPAATPTASPTATKPAAAAPTATPSATPSGTKPAEEKIELPTLRGTSPEERKRIETQNKEKQAKYEADLKAGAEKAKKLNAQFADWFYVVSDTTFQGLNVDPTTLVKKPAPPTPPQGGPPPGFPGLPPGMRLPPQ